MSKEEISYLIKTFRHELDLTQQALADKTGLSLTTIRDIEQGRGNPSVDVLDRIGRVLGLKVTMVYESKTKV